VPVDPARATRTTVYGFRQLAQLPDADELRRYYSQRYYQEGTAGYRDEYDELEAEHIQAAAARKVAAARRFAPSLPATGSLLDVGCGEGYVLALFAAEGWDVVGVDFSSSAVAQHHPELAPLVETGDLFESLDRVLAGGKRFDLLWLDNVLEHVLDPERLLRQCRHVMAPHGALVVEVPNDFSIVQRDLVRLGLIEDSAWVFVPDHVSYFDRSSLVALADAAGWECGGCIADMPIDWFLYHPLSNYYRNPDAGPGAHRARMAIDVLLSRQPSEDVLALLEAMAQVGLGRQIIAVFTPRRS
jgi:2-polyprenyl-3-methyl-5-hydroxy-6-metoxy-1,4-benzoquinol methylase